MKNKKTWKCNSCRCRPSDVSSKSKLDKKVQKLTLRASTPRQSVQTHKNTMRPSTATVAPGTVATDESPNEPQSDSRPHNILPPSEPSMSTGLQSIHPENQTDSSENLTLNNNEEGKQTQQMPQSDSTTEEVLNMTQHPPSSHTEQATTSSSSTTQTSQISDYKYVTQRKKNAVEALHTSLPTEELSSLLSETDSSRKFDSLPDLSTLYNEEIMILKQDVADLKCQLLAAETLVENITLEKMSLEKIIVEQSRKIKDLLYICSSTPRKSENNPNKTKKRKRGKSRKGNKANKENDYSIFSTNITNINQDKSEQMETQREKSENNNNKRNSTYEESSFVYNHSTASDPSTRRKRIFIVADQQGRGLQRALEKLMSSEYEICCFWKNQANLTDVLNTCKTEIESLTMHDFIVVVGGVNDRNPAELKYHLLKWLNSIVNTNIVICGLPYNANMHNANVNYDMKMICLGFRHSTFVRMNYNKSFLGSKWFTQNVSFSIYREILHLHHNNVQHSLPTNNKHIENNTLQNVNDKSKSAHNNFPNSEEQTSKNLYQNPNNLNFL
ncbi:hypothetical protein O0L34_g17707 [Tuta absoluta]|nr:hypothetical protein O0L34_g17707 [Tuta absoluta]